MIHCDRCPKKKYCSCLCPEAELFVNQDAKPQRELIIGLPRWGKVPTLDVFTKKEKTVIRLLLNGCSRKIICEILNISRSQLRVHLTNIAHKS